MAIIAVCAVVLLLGGAARAADMVPADGLALGGAVAADGRSPASFLFSPATMALEARYDVYAGARLGYKDDWLFQVQARDSRTGPVALGMAWAMRTASPPPETEDLPGWRGADEELENPVEETAMALGLGGAVLQRRLAFGVSGLRYGRDSAFTEPENRYDAGVGVAYRPLAPLTLSVGAANLVDLFDDSDKAPPLTAAGGVGLRSSIASAFAAADLDLSAPSERLPLSWRAGGELTLLDGGLPLRAGLHRDAALDTTFLSLGLGLSATMGGLDYTFVRDIGPDSGATALTGVRTWHALSLRAQLPEAD